MSHIQQNNQTTLKGIEMATDRENRKFGELTSAYSELERQEKSAIDTGNEKHLRHVRSAMKKCLAAMKQLVPGDELAKAAEKRAATSPAHDPEPPEPINLPGDPKAVGFGAPFSGARFARPLAVC